MFSENTLMLYQQDAELGPYFVKSQPAQKFSLIILQNNYSGPNS